MLTLEWMLLCGGAAVESGGEDEGEDGKVNLIQLMIWSDV